MTSPLHIPLDALERGPMRVAGVLPGTVLELEGEQGIRNVGEVGYELKVERTGSEILATGTVEAPLELECVRSGRFFSTILRESSFLRDYSTEEIGEILDLTEDVREAVLLRLPSFPVSPEAQSDEFELPKLPEHLQDDGGDSPWDDLDNLNV